MQLNLDAIPVFTEFLVMAIINRAKWCSVDRYIVAADRSMITTPICSGKAIERKRYGECVNQSRGQRTLGENCYETGRTTAACHH